MPELPTGTVTFLFTDVEGSTRLLHELGSESYAEALAEHRRVIREACAEHGGVEVDTQGDAFFFAFPTAPGALAAAGAMTQALASGSIRVRVGVHTGTPLLTDEGYVGGDVHRAARIAAAGHGGQVLVSSSTAALVADGLHDLGAHRFKDLSAPERVFQLGVTTLPPLRTLHQTNLPVPATPFVGRARELEETIALLSRDGVRLLTLTGPGGSGKTRLALQAAGALAEHYPDGVWWVPLAALRDPEQVLESASLALGAKLELAAHIADKQLLLLFDNFEHVAEAAGGLAALLESCPNLELLVTSREPLRLRGEQEYPVPPFVHAEAVAFFTARASAADPAFEVDESVDEICRRLDELPLALELAAARVKALSSSQILARLERRLPLLTGGARDAPARQRTLRATIEWSHDLLEPDEQVLMRQLGAFGGGCTLDAAEAVCGADLDTLQSLVAKSLVRFSEERYWMLETIREYALEQLERSGERAALRERHAAYYLALAEATGGLNLHQGEQAASLERLAVEVDNLRAAIEWSIELDRPDLVHRFGAALWFFWSLRGHVAEGRRVLEAAVTDTDRSADTWLWGALALGELDRGHGDLERARHLKEVIVPMLRERGETRALAGTLADLGDLAMRDGDYDRARGLLEESLELRRHPAAALGKARTVASLAELALLEDDLDRAEALAEQAVELNKERDPQSAHAGWALGLLGDIRCRRGDLRLAEDAYRDSLRIMHVLRDELGVAGCLEAIAAIASAFGDDERAGRLVGAAETLRHEAGPSDASESPLVDVPEHARREGAALSLDEAVAYALEEVPDA